jgi:uncharacterized protein YcaQ
MRQIPIQQARRIALAAQGFDRARPTGRIDARHFRRVVGQVGILQLDTVSVLARAHYLPFFSRLGAYPIEAMDRWAYDSGELFEYWGHAASLMPVAHYPMLRHRMSQHEGWQRVEKLKADRPGYVESIVEQIRAAGPLTIRDLEDAGERFGGWWRSEARVALAHLHACGGIASTRRPDFTRVYDLPERAIRSEALSAPPLDRRAAQLAMVEQAARSMGLATRADLADYYRIHQHSAQQAAEALIEAGCLEQVSVEGWAEPAYLHAEAKQPRRVKARSLLSPFDSLVWYRQRIERLWDFHYRIEIYVPEPKRKFGYYVLPFLVDEDLAARVDLKADRKAGLLRVRAAWLEAGRDVERVAHALVAELREMAAWLGLEGPRVEKRGDLWAPLSTALGRD